MGVVLPCTIVNLVLTLTDTTCLGVLRLNSRVTHNLNIGIRMAHVVLATVTTLLTTDTMDIINLLNFINLIIPRTTQLLVNDSCHFLLPTSTLLNVTVIALDSAFTHMVFTPVRLPINVVVTFLNTPFFLFLLEERV